MEVIVLNEKGSDKKMNLIERIKTIDFENYELKFQETPNYLVAIIKNLAEDAYYDPYEKELDEEEVLEFREYIENYKLREDALEVINDAILEVAMRMDDLETFKEYFNKVKRFDFKTPFCVEESNILKEIKEFEHYLKSDTKRGLNSLLYNEIFEEVGSPLKLKSENENGIFKLEKRPLELDKNKEKYFDHLLMLLVVALEGRDIKKYIYNIILPPSGSKKYKEYKIVERAAVLGKVNFVKFLLEQGAEIPESTRTESVEIKEIFKKAQEGSFKIKLQDKLYPLLSNSPTYAHISEWIKQYKKVYYVKADLYRRYDILSLTNEKDILELMKMNKNSGIRFILKKADKKDISGFEKREDNQENLYEFLEKNSVLHKSQQTMENFLEAYLMAGIEINKIQNFKVERNRTKPEETDFTEADELALIYENEQEYRDNH